MYICGESAEAKQAVIAVATKLGFSALDRGSISVARELEDFPLQLFPQWRLPLRIAIGLSAAFFFYLLIRDIMYAYVTQGEDISFRIMVSLANQVLAHRPSECLCSVCFYVCCQLFKVCSCSLQVCPIVSLIMLSLCYLPGVLASFLQLYRGTKYRSDLCVYVCVCMHVCSHDVAYVFMLIISVYVCLTSGASLIGWIAGCCAGNSWVYCRWGSPFCTCSIH